MENGSILNPSETFRSSTWTAHEGKYLMTVKGEALEEAIQVLIWKDNGNELLDCEVVSQTDSEVCIVVEVGIAPDFEVVVENTSNRSISLCEIEVCRIESE